MKTIYFVLSSVLFLLSINAFNLSTEEGNESESKNNIKLNFHSPEPPDISKALNFEENKMDSKEIDRNWYQTALENIKNAEYNITYDEKLGLYQSPNRENNIRFIYHKDGFTAFTRQTSNVRGETEKDWSIEFRLSNVKREMPNVKSKTQDDFCHSPYTDRSPYSCHSRECGNLLSNSCAGEDCDCKCINSRDRENVGMDLWDSRIRGNDKSFGFDGSEINVKDNTAFIEDDNIRIDYTNNKDGMRQDFIIKNKPEGDGNLRLNLSAETKLQMIVGADALMFKDENGIDKMKYSALKCWDANGRELRAYFEKNQLGIKNYELGIKDDGLEGKSKIEKIPNSKFLIPNPFSIVVNDEDAVYPITIDPLSTSPDWTNQQNQANANYGFSVATAGDVNGDKYSDVIIGTPDFDNGQTDEGKVFVFFGSATGLSATADWTAESDQTNAFFGGSVATAGDVNGDGYSDIIAGAIGYDGVNVDGGAIFLWAGSSSGLGANGNPSNSDFDGYSSTGSDFGFSVSTAGDVNGDGYSDIIIGAQKLANGESEEGRAFLFLGSNTGPSSSPDWLGESNQASARFGCSVATAGDVNGDGRSDVIIGSSYYDNGETDEGSVFLWYGTAGGLGSDGTPANADWSGESNQANAHLGVCVATAGDVNGDGYSDVITGADLYDNGQTNEGKAFMWYGSSTGPGTTGTPLNADFSKESNQADANLGYIATTAGDVNGDGYSDIVINAYLYDNGQTNEGKVWAYFGSASGPDTTSDWTSESDQANADFGFGLATAGDVNGDGYSDVLTGAFLYDDGQTDEGQVYLFNGSPLGLSDTTNWTKSGSVSDDNFGESVSSAGDVNGDGYSDVLVSAPFYDGGQTDEGRVYLFLGDKTGIKTTVSATIESNQADANLGVSVSTSGDVNGDGYCDVIIGAPLYDSGQVNEGRAYIYLGSSGSPYLSSSTVLESNQANADFGVSVSTAGDVNGDGYSDVIVGADTYGNGEANEGGAFVYYGSAVGISKIANWSVEGDQTGAKMGNAVATAGDVNGDGYSDIIVGASNFNNGNTDEGRAYVYYGSSTGLSATEDWKGESNQNDGRFGFSVSTAGDVNGDGFSDIIIGASLYDNGHSNEGSIYLWTGSASGLGANGTPGNAVWSAQSNQNSAQLGRSVSTAGDVNGDGYSDVIAGARLYSNGENEEGRIFLWQGSPTGLGSNGTPGNSDWSAESDQANAHLGSSVAAAGDVNGDGYSDIICGAPDYDDGFTNNGKGFAYYGNGGNGIKTTIAQYESVTTNILYSGARTGTAGQVRLNIFAKSPFGRADGRIVYEVKINGLPFSGDPITNSTAATGSGTFTDMGSTITGVPLNFDLTGLPQNKEFKWRARLRYDAVNNPYQSLGPWKYYTNYVPVPFGCFKPITVDDTPPSISYTTLSDSVPGSSRYLTGVTITDASGVNGTSGSRPRVYYKVKSDSNVFNDNTNATAGWKFSEASNSNSPFSFIINHSRLNGGISILDTVQYFVIAQDIRAFGPVHVGINSGIFASTPVNDSLTSAAFPITGLIHSYKITDNVAPSISFTNLTDTASLTNRNFTNVVITDASGINGTAGTRPRVYYKKISNPNEFNDNTNTTTGWKYAEATGSTSPFSFVINYSLINGGLQTSDTLVYFVVAQDLAPTPNIKIVQGTFNSPPASVNLPSAAFPIGGSLKGYKITDLGPPEIAFTNLPDTASLNNRILNNVVITDSSGIQGSAGFRPRVYYKRKTDANTFNDNTNATAGWKYASASGSTSPFSFTINYSLLNESIAANDTVQYFVVAQDKYIPPFVAINSGTFAASPSSVNLTNIAFPVSGTINSYAILSPPAMDLYLTVAIQGFYNAAFNSIVQDTVTVYLRNSSSPYNIVDTASAYINGAGKIGLLPTQYSFNNAVNNTPYYIQVIHRNSITTWSADTMSFAGNELYYDFSDAASKAYGDNMIQADASPVVFAIYSGDVNQDGVIDASDNGAIDNDATNFETGYLSTDLNGDEVIDASDAAIADNNAANFVSAVVP